MIDTIIFDLGGVLIDWNPRNLYRKIFDDEKEMEFFLREIPTPLWNELQDGGRPLQEATDWLVARHFGYEKEIRAYYSRWTEMLNGPIQGTVDILETLIQQKKYPIYALTNWSHETFPIALERFEFLKWFKAILVSGVEKMKKPDREIYELILDRYSINANTTVFIDDSLRNIEGAKAVGLQTIHFQSSEQLAVDLKKMGIEF